MIYLASPYSHKDPGMLEARYQAARRCTARLIRKGQFVWSPIVHCHPMAHAHDLPNDAEFWKAYNTDFIRRCDKLIVLTLDGWKESVGVQEEIKLAMSLDIPVEYTEG